MSLISLKHVNMVYGHKPLLKDIHFDINSNEIITIIGPNGCGKTTLLKIILGLIKPSLGHVEVTSRLRFGYMPQRIAIDPVLPLTVRRFLRLTSHMFNLRTVNNVETIAKKVGISHLMRQQIHDVSGGELQRILLARAMLQKPDILVLDEPTQGLDVQGQAEFYQLIDSLRQEYGCAVLMVSHDLHFVMSTTDRVICINQHICCQGHPSEVSQNPEYLSLFGKERLSHMALYTHQHDHQHDLKGKVIKSKRGKKK